MKNTNVDNTEYLNPLDEPELECEWCNQEITSELGCGNKYCPGKFKDDETIYDMACRFVETLDDLYRWKKKYAKLYDEYTARIKITNTLDILLRLDYSCLVIGDYKLYYDDTVESLGELCTDEYKEYFPDGYVVLNIRGISGSRKEVYRGQNLNDALTFMINKSKEDE